MDLVNEITDGIGKALSKAFPDCEIYQNDVEQGLTEPCFFVAPLEVSRVQMVGARWRQDMPFQITYLPKEGRDNRSMNETAARLYLALNFVEGENGSLHHGYGMRHQLVDDTIQFTVNYTAFLILPEEIPDMEQLKQQTTLKEE